MPFAAVPVQDRFWTRADCDGGGCWPWLGYVRSDGYGEVSVDGSGRGAHCVAYELAVGPIPEGMTIDHLCHTTGCSLTADCPHRRCVNPAHLEPKSMRDNLLRGNTLPARNVAVTHCPQGHRYSAENTYRYPDGRRRCRSCHRDEEADRRAKRRGVR